MADPVLTTMGLTKRFGPVQALSEVDFTLERGELHALLGVNGAGKSTFIKVLSGVYTRDAGVVTVDGRSVDFRTPADAIASGIAAVQQHPELVPDLNGYENIFLGREGARRGLLSRVDPEELKRRGDELLARFPIAIDLGRPVGGLSAVVREIVAVLQALSRTGIRVLILDEPTSTLTEVEKVALFRMIATLKSSGIAIIYITHRLEEVLQVADRLTVFRGGRLIATKVVAEAASQRLSLAELMLGESVGHVFPPKRAAPGDGEPILFEVDGLRSAGRFDDVRFSVRRGEIVGIFGLVGSGLDELSKAMFGVMPADGGQIRVEGRPVAVTSPQRALEAGLFLVPGDRRSEGLTLARSTIFNTTIAKLGKASTPFGLLRWRANRRRTRALADQVALTPPLLDRPVAGFSGGNQQKIVVAKGLFTEAKVYLFVEPTIGVDIGARAKLYALMRGLADKAAVVVMSTDCDEVFGLVDRSFALYKGRQVSAPSASIGREQLLTAGMMGRPA